MPFVDGQAWFTVDSFETDAPLQPDAHVYESTDTHIVGVNADGSSFEFVFVDGQWSEVSVDKPVETWTNEDFAATEMQYPTGYGWSLQDEPDPADDWPDTMSLGAIDHLLIA